MPFSASYSLLGLASLAVQVFFAVHAYRSGRIWWIFVLFFFPVVGPLVYLFAEYLPSARAGRLDLDGMGRRVVERLNPQRRSPPAAGRRVPAGGSKG